MGKNSVLAILGLGLGLVLIGIGRAEKRRDEKPPSPLNDVLDWEGEGGMVPGVSNMHPGAGDDVQLH
ncbi:hypothetical protein [Chitinivorax sp. B]|uniref:hypothetical protein n=1 Tax=Chitinivorax sp. B TaxID=2502235 RepID=UPI0010F70EDF|nr:hypothetical protein [Chitinivorax sp. B]